MKIEEQNFTHFNGDFKGSGAGKLQNLLLKSWTAETVELKGKLIDSYSESFMKVCLTYEV